MDSENDKTNGTFVTLIVNMELRYVTASIRHCLRMRGFGTVPAEHEHIEFIFLVEIRDNMVTFIIITIRREDMKCGEMILHLFKQNDVLSNRAINAHVLHLQPSKNTGR
jgi:hypothetical protein